MQTGTVEPGASRAGDVGAIIARADVLLAARKPGEAVALLQQVTGEHPDNAWLWHKLAAGLLAMDGGPDTNARARDAAERAVTLRPTSAVGYRLLSEAALRLGDPDAALATMKAAVQAAPESWVAHLDLAAALASRPGQEREAWRAARQAAKLAPADRAEPHLILGDFALRDGDLSHAAAAYTDALDRDPANNRAQAGLADVFGRMNDVTQSIPTVAGATGGGAPDAARAVGNHLAGFALIAVLGLAMLLLLAPERAETWFTASALMAVGGLVLVGAASSGGDRAALARLSSRAGYLTGVLCAGLLCLATLVLLAVGAFVDNGSLLLRAALVTALAGYTVGHLVSRFADRAGRYARTDPDRGRDPEALRSGAFLGLTVGNLLHAVVFGLLAVLADQLLRGAVQTISVTLTLALTFLNAIQLAAIWSNARVHRRRFGWWPVWVLINAVLAILVSLLGLAGALASLFGPATVPVLIGAAVAAAVLTAVTGLGALNLRREP